MLFTTAGIYSPAQVGMVAPLTSNSQTAFGNNVDIGWSTVIPHHGILSQGIIMLSTTVTAPDFAVQLFKNGGPTPFIIDVGTGLNGSGNFDTSVICQEGDTVTWQLLQTGDTGSFSIGIRFTEA